MRSGVIAKKLGMTRLFLEDGKQVPVTVLQMENVQVVAQRTADRDGYSAVQLGAGAAKPKNTTQAMRGHFALAKVEPKRKIAEFRVSPENLIEVGEEITADHYFAGQFVDIAGTIDRQGLRRRHEAAQLRRPPGVARRVDQPPLARLDRPVPGPGQGVQGQEDGRPHGRRPGHHPEPAGRPHRQRARPDHGQGRGAGLQGRLGHDQGRGQEGHARQRDPAGGAALRGPQGGRGCREGGRGSGGCGRGGRGGASRRAGRGRGSGAGRGRGRDQGRQGRRRRRGGDAPAEGSDKE